MRIDELTVAGVMRIDELTVLAGRSDELTVAGVVVVVLIVNYANR